MVFTTQIYLNTNALGGRKVHISVSQNSNLNCINAGATAGFVLRSAVRSPVFRGRETQQRFGGFFHWIAKLSATKSA
jgi:hypothetical protein